MGLREPQSHQTQGVFVGCDTSTGGQCCKIGSPEGEKTDVDTGGDWMIRVELVSVGGPCGGAPTSP